MNSLKRILIPIGVGLGLLAFLALAGSSLVLFREAMQVHPALGALVVLLFAAAGWLLILYPIGMVLRLPRALIAPRKDDADRYRAYLTRYARRLLGNSHLKARHARLAELEATLRDAKRGGDVASLSSEIDLALIELDREANSITRRHAAAVFVATGVSQSGRLDSGIVLSTQLRLVNEIARLYYQQPTPRELWNVYANVGAAAFVAGEIQDSELLAVLGAPVSAALSGFVPLHGTGPLVSLLVQSLLDGSANALLTLRVGVLARRACAPTAIEDRRLFARSAALEAAGLLGGVVGDGSLRIAKATRNLAVEAMAKSPGTAMRGLAAGSNAVLEGISRAADRATSGVARVSKRAADAVARMVGKQEAEEASGAEEDVAGAAVAAVNTATVSVDPSVLQDTARFWDHVANFFAGSNAAASSTERR